MVARELDGSTGRVDVLDVINAAVVPPAAVIEQGV